MTSGKRSGAPFGCFDGSFSLWSHFAITAGRCCGCFMCFGYSWNCVIAISSSVNDAVIDRHDTSVAPLLLLALCHAFVDDCVVLLDHALELHNEADQQLLLASSTGVFRFHHQL